MNTIALKYVCPHKNVKDAWERSGGEAKGEERMGMKRYELQRDRKNEQKYTRPSTSTNVHLVFGVEQLKNFVEFVCA